MFKQKSVTKQRVCRCILSMQGRTSEEDTKIKTMNLGRLMCKHKILMFVFKNEEFFGLYNTEKYTRLQDASVATYPKWRKLHFRLQAKGIEDIM